MGAWTDIGMCHHGIAGLADFEDIERRLCITVAVRDRLSQSENLSGCIALGKTSRCRKPGRVRQCSLIAFVKLMVSATRLMVLFEVRTAPPQHGVGWVEPANVVYAVADRGRARAC